MPTSLEEQIGPDRFCINPYVKGCGGTVFRLMPEQGTHSYLRLEVCEGAANGTRLSLGRHLVKEYKRAQQPDEQARFDGTLELNHLCKATDDGFIEPSRESR
jgi:hypothetical protein